LYRKSKNTEPGLGGGGIWGVLKKLKEKKGEPCLKIARLTPWIRWKREGRIKIVENREKGKGGGGNKRNRRKLEKKGVDKNCGRNDVGRPLTNC